jgi:hypothetical protein
LIGFWVLALALLPVSIPKDVDGLQKLNQCMFKEQSNGILIIATKETLVLILPT